MQRQKKIVATFQFTPLREGRRCRNIPFIHHLKFQFTPLREGRLVFVDCNFPRCISIHAPPRGATNEGDAFFNAYEFQFTPLREGRRLKICILINPFCNFNSRPSARGDFRRRVADLKWCISIHAPPRGATCRARARIGTAPNFNSRPSARGDTTVTISSCNSLTFQFTPLREGRRLQNQPRQRVHRYFNSRPSARGDGRDENAFSPPDFISIHAPPRGATICVCRL